MGRPTREGARHPMRGFGLACTRRSTKKSLLNDLVGPRRLRRTHEDLYGNVRSEELQKRSVASCPGGA